MPAAALKGAFCAPKPFLGGGRAQGLLAGPAAAKLAKHCAAGHAEPGLAPRWSRSCQAVARCLLQAALAMLGCGKLAL